MTNALKIDSKSVFKAFLLNNEWFDFEKEIVGLVTERSCFLDK